MTCRWQTFSYPPLTACFVNPGHRAGESGAVKSSGEESDLLEITTAPGFGYEEITAAVKCQVSRLVKIGGNHSRPVVIISAHSMGAKPHKAERDQQCEHGFGPT